MSRTIRRILLFISCLAFAIIAPLIIFYAMGYRGELVGVALVKAVPKKASIEVAGKGYGTLPRSIPNLTPGETSIRVTKSGYIPWEKRVRIEPGAATNLRSIQLIPSVIDQDILIGNSKVFAFSQSSIASVDSTNRLAIYDDRGVPRTPLISLTRSPIALTWSPDGSYVLLSYPKQSYEVFRIEGDALRKIIPVPGSGSMSVQWDPTRIGNLFFITPTRDLVSYDLMEGVSTLVTKDVNSFSIHNRDLIIHLQDNALIAKRIGSEDETQIIPDTQKRIQQIIPGPNEYIALRMADGEVRLVTRKGEIHHIAPQSKLVAWSLHGNILLIQTSSGELHAYVPEGVVEDVLPTTELHLIMRLSRPLTFIGWMPDSQHILYETDGNLIFSEIDTRDHVISNKIQEASGSPTSIAIEREGKSIVALQKQHTGTSLVRTWLVTQEDR